MESTFNTETRRHANRIRIQQNAEYQQLIDEIKAIEKLIDSFGFLQFGRDYIMCDKWSISLQSLITSIELTAGNIVACCEYACIADANILLRKYRDDLFFYLYIVVFDSSKNSENPFGNKKMKENILRWIKNGLDNFNINEVFKAVGTSQQLKEAVDAYDLKKSFAAIGKRLNRFVHGNGYAYYNRFIEAYEENEFSNFLKTFVDDLKYVTVTYLFLLILCSPISMMSTDYIDYLDCGESPPEDSQYWVAPFIMKFMSENTSLIDENCYKYLLENTKMQFDPDL